MFSNISTSFNIFSAFWAILCIPLHSPELPKNRENFQIFSEIFKISDDFSRFSKKCHFISSDFMAFLRCLDISW
jgi:hypothetical protein